MNRAFTIRIYFKEKFHTALVKLRDEGYDLSILVRYIDKEIQTILPDGKLIFSLSQGVKLPASFSEEITHDLFYCTSEAIAEYLQAHDN